MFVVATVFITFLYPLTARTPTRIDELRFRRIKPGMTEAEVETVFGAPAGHYGVPAPDPVDDLIVRLGDGTHNQISFGLPLANGEEQGQVKHWASTHGYFNVGFTDGRVKWAIGFKHRPWDSWFRLFRRSRH